MAQKHRITILHIDDNEANRYVVTRMLEKEGFEVTGAATGEEGLQLIAQYQPDLVVLDVKLPDINGFEVCRRIKENTATSGIPVLHLSAYFVRIEDRAQGLEGGADAYLVQPVESLELVATIRALLRVRQAEEKALGMARQWQTTFDAIGDGVCLLDREGRVMRCNRAMAEFLEKPFSEIETRCHQELMVSRLGVGDGDLFNRLRETKTRESQEVQSHNCWFQISVDPIFDRDSTVTGAVYIVADISDRKRSEEWLHFLAEASAELGASLDYKTNLTNVAKRAVPRIADWCVVDMVEEDGSVYRLAVAHENDVKVNLAWELAGRYPEASHGAMGVTKAIRTGISQWAVEVPESVLASIGTDGEPLRLWQELGWKSYLILPMVAGGRTLGAIAFIMAESGRHYTPADLSLAQELARRAAVAVDNARLYREAEEANRLKDDFLATLSHELRSPLNSMLGWAQLLKNRKFDERMTAKAVETIERNARLQVQLVEDLLDVSRIIRGKLQLQIRPVEMGGVIEAALDTMRPAAEAKGIGLETELDLEVGLVAGDADRLQQIVWNLVSNAVKFTPSGGRVLVRLKQVASLSEMNWLATAEPSHPGKLATTESEGHAQVEMRVSDTGQGIQPDFLPFVFDRFRQADSSITRSYTGLGLGLAIVRHLVELHGGTVRAESEGEGRGATFIVKLPMMRLRKKGGDAGLKQSPVGNRDKLEGQALLAGLQVLVVDDDADTKVFLTVALQECGAQVIAVSSAPEAIAAIKEYQPDVLVSDIGMPGEDGYSLIRKVRALSNEEGGKIPAVALTAYARPEDQTRSLGAGFQIHLPKPIEPTELVGAVGKLAGRSGWN